MMMIPCELKDIGISRVIL